VGSPVPGMFVSGACQSLVYEQSMFGPIALCHELAPRDRTQIITERYKATKSDGALVFILFAIRQIRGRHWRGR
jgi:hypothetical protein